MRTAPVMGEIGDKPRRVEVVPETPAVRPAPVPTPHVPSTPVEEPAPV